MAPSYRHRGTPASVPPPTIRPMAPRGPRGYGAGSCFFARTRMSETAIPQSRAGLLQPIVAGLLGAFVGFASSFTILLAGYAALGANPAEAASALFAVSLGTGLLTMLLAGRAKMPVTIAWSTPSAGSVDSVCVTSGPG